MAVKTSQGASSRFRWVLPAIASAALFVADVAMEPLRSHSIPKKGSIARTTIRAQRDAVFDLHETYVAEAREAKQSYLPIYNKDNDLLWTEKRKIRAAALAQPIESWSWNRLPAQRGDGAISGADGGADGAPAVRIGPPAPTPNPDGSAPDGRRLAASDDGGAGPPQRDLEAIWSARRKELGALIEGVFKLLANYYRVGVIADNEFPNEKRVIRIFSRGRYVTRKVSKLYRFSQLRSALLRSAGQFFFKTEPQVRRELIEYVLQRLPANLSYARVNAKFIADISEVTGIKVVLIRRGDVLVPRGKVVDTRAHYAIRASVRAARETSRTQRRAGRLALVLSLLFAFVFASSQLAPVALGGRAPLILVFGGILVLAVGGQLTLLYWPVHVALIPQASLALIAAVVLGQAGAVLVAMATSASLAFLFYFDLRVMIVGAAGGVVAALLVRKRQRAAVLPASVLVGVVQALALEACRAASGEPQSYPQMVAAAQAFGGGLLSGVLALISLPFIQRGMGRASRGKLRVLTDYEHPLIRRMRERRPDVFAHTLRVVSLSDRAAKRIGADRLLTRAGATFHDIGKLRTGSDDGSPAAGESARERAQRRREHIDAGIRLAREHRLPPEIVAFIREHHGTLAAADPSPEASLETVADVDLCFVGPRPRSLESAIVMIANEVEHATRDRDFEGVEPARLVEKILIDLFTHLQFAECGMTQRQMQRIQRAMVGYLEEHRE